MSRQANEYKIASTAFILLLPVFFVFHGYVEIYPFVPIPSAAVLVCYYILGTSFLFLIFLALFRSWAKAGIAAFLLSSFYLFFGFLHDQSIKLFGNNIFTRYTFIIPASAVILLFVFVKIYRSTRSFHKPVRFINLLLLVLILLDAVFVLTKPVWKPKVEEQKMVNATCDTCVLQDVYLIVADEYAGRKALRDIFHTDNSAFEKSLEQRGFHWVSGIKSNYSSTPFSMNSLLNFNYIPLKEGYDISQETREAIGSIEYAAVPAFFASKGYSVINHSVFDLNENPSQAIEIFGNTKTKYIRSQTFLQRVDKDLSYMLKTKFNLPAFLRQRLTLYDNDNNNRKLYQRTLKTAAENHQLKFVYTHLIMPHYPYYYNEKGQPNSDTVLFDKHGQSGYLGFLKYTNGELIRLIDSIQKNQTRPTAIVLLSDHGFRSYDKKKWGPGYQFDNMCAVYLPGGNYSGWYDGMSNVNLFRVFLNQAFQQKLPLLPDTSIQLKELSVSGKSEE